MIFFLTFFVLSYIVHLKNKNQHLNLLIKNVNLLFIGGIYGQENFNGSILENRG